MTPRPEPRHGGHRRVIICDTMPPRGGRRLHRCRHRRQHRGATFEEYIHLLTSVTVLAAEELIGSSPAAPTLRSQALLHYWPACLSLTRPRGNATTSMLDRFLLEPSSEQGAASPVTRAESHHYTDAHDSTRRRTAFSAGPPSAVHPDPDSRSGDEKGRIARP